MAISRPWNKGRKETRPEALERIRAAAAAPTRREKISKALRGRIFSEEHRKRLSKPRQRPFPESYREKQRARMTGVPMRQKIREKIRRSLLGKPHTLERRKALRAVRARQWRDPRYVRAVFAGWNRRPNRLERNMLDLLEKHFPNQWAYVGDGSFSLGRCIPDFLNVNGQKAVIEVFGRHWHQPEDTERRTAHFLQYGFRTLVLWEDEPESTVIAKVQTFVGEPWDRP